MEGARQVTRTVTFYNLDLIISLGYRVNTKRGIAFRQWATSVLKDYLIKGYAINQRIREENYRQMVQTRPLHGTHREAAASQQGSAERPA